MCDIVDVGIEGRDLLVTGRPSRYFVTARIRDCAEVDITITTPGGGVLYQKTAAPVPGTIDPTIFVDYEYEALLAESLACGANVVVTVRCVADPTCQVTDTFPIACEPAVCPTVELIVTDSAGDTVDIAQDCLPSADYTVTAVVTPAGVPVTYWWTINSGPPSLGTDRVLVTLPPDANAGDVEVKVDIGVPASCPPTSDQVLFPASPPAGGCPSESDLVVIVTKDGVPITPPLTGLAPGTYRVEVTAPLNADDYEFTLGSGSPEPTAGARFFEFDVGANETIVLGVRIDLGPCCDPLIWQDVFSSSLPECPDSMTVQVVASDGSIVAGTIGLATGVYRIVVTDPLGATSYTFAEPGGPVLKTGVENFYDATLGSGDTLTVVVTVDPGPGCQPLQEQVDLTAAATVEPTDNGGGAGGGFNLCDAIALLAILALIATLIMVLLIVCSVPVPPVAIGVAAGAAVVLFALLFAFCPLWTPCRIWGAIAWCFMWSTVIGAVIALICTSWLVALVAVGYGIIVGLMSIWLNNRGCPVPQPFALP